jgi:hypothetical protein
MIKRKGVSEINIQIIIVVLFLAVIIPLSYGGWKLKRYINWKFSYGNKVENRIELLEKRVEVLENKIQHLPEL